MVSVTYPPRKSLWFSWRKDSVPTCHHLWWPHLISPSLVSDKYTRGRQDKYFVSAAQFSVNACLKWSVLWNICQPFFLFELFDLNFDYQVGTLWHSRADWSLLWHHHVESVPHSYVDRYTDATMWSLFHTVTWMGKLSDAIAWRGTLFHTVRWRGKHVIMYIISIHSIKTLMFLVYTVPYPLYEYG